MKRSEINALIQSASLYFTQHHWVLPDCPKWDVTDFGLGDWRKNGLVLVNLAEEKEYCEKLMYAKKGMTTPAHCHQRKKEDIISRWGALRVKVWESHPRQHDAREFQIQIDGEKRGIRSGEFIDLKSGSRITITPGVYHEFYPLDEECIIGEVSTENDDLHDNFFANQETGRYPGIEEDELPIVKLVSEK